jgi:hypothetical protein
MEAYLASCEAIWLQKLLMGLFEEELETTVIRCDNQICIKLSENPVFHDRSKHIEIRYHFIRDCVQKGSMRLQFVPISERIVDITHKAFGERQICFLQRQVGGCAEHLPR